MPFDFTTIEFRDWEACVDSCTYDRLGGKGEILTNITYLL